MPVAADLSTELDASLQWLLPNQHGDPVTCLQRIRMICLSNPDLFSTLMTVVATHQGVPRERLAAAVQQFRPDLRSFSQEDVVSLFNGLWNGGRSGFDSVLRTRKSGERKAAAMPFIRPD